MPSSKPKSYFTKGKGVERKVHPIFAPKGPRLPKSGPAHPSRNQAYQTHVKSEVSRRRKRSHTQRSGKTMRVLKGKTPTRTFTFPDHIWKTKELGPTKKRERRKKKEVKVTPKPKAKYDKVIKKKQKKKWKYGVLWRNKEGKVGYSVTKASSKTEAYENAKKWPLFKEVISAKHESESEYLKEQLKKEAIASSPSSSTKQQWNNMSTEKRKKLMRMLNKNEKWASNKFEDLPVFVRKDLYDITSGRRIKARVKKQLEEKGKLMEEYSRSPTTKGWKEFQKEKQQPIKPKRAKRRIKKKRVQKIRTKMTHIEKMHLLSAAKQFRIDPQEIDNTLTYYENKKHLHAMAKAKGVSEYEIRSSEEQSREWANEYSEYLSTVKEELKSAGYKVEDPNM